MNPRRTLPAPKTTPSCIIALFVFRPDESHRGKVGAADDGELHRAEGGRHPGLQEHSLAGFGDLGPDVETSRMIGSTSLSKGVAPYRLWWM